MKTSIYKAIALALLPSLLLAGCAGARYKSDVPCEDVTKKAVEILSDGLEYAEFDGSHVDMYFNKAAFEDFFVIYSTETNDINEIGVFRAADERSAKQTEAACLDYVKTMRDEQRAFISSYAPDELPKLERARVHRYGNYVVYTILTPEETDAVLDGTKQLLRK